MLWSDANRMNIFNLASPNLVKGSNPLRDVVMCSATTSTYVFWFKHRDVCGLSGRYLRKREYRRRRKNDVRDGRHSLH